MGSEMGKMKLQKIVENFLISFENWVHEWNGRQEIFSLPQAIENSREFLLLLLRTDVSQKTVFGCPCYGSILCMAKGTKSLSNNFSPLK